MSKSWQRVRLGEVLQRIKDEIRVEDNTTYARLTIRMNGKGIRLRDRVPGHAIGTKRQFAARTGQLVLSKIDARNGAFGILPSEGDNAIITGNFWAFDVNREWLLPPYFDFLTKTPLFVEFCVRASEGTTNRRYLQEGQFLAQEIPLPPVAEQRRIVARIEALAAKIDEARILREQATRQTEALLASYLRSLFEAGSSKGWTPGKLGDYVIDDCYGTSEKTTDDKTGVPILGMGNIQNGHLNTRSLKYLHLSERDLCRLRLLKGDIVINRTNSAELVGKCAVFDLNIECSFASYLIRLRVDQQRANPALVAAYINSPIGREYMLREKRQMTGQANVNATRLKDLPMTLPPFPEQLRIVASLEALEKKIGAAREVQSETSAELDALMPSILDKAFRGEL